jgi:hypothetical protein
MTSRQFAARKEIGRSKCARSEEIHAAEPIPSQSARSTPRRRRPTQMNSNALLVLIKQSCTRALVNTERACGVGEARDTGRNNAQRSRRGLRRPTGKSEALSRLHAEAWSGSTPGRPSQCRRAKVWATKKTQATLAPFGKRRARERAGAKCTQTRGICSENVKTELGGGAETALTLFIQCRRIGRGSLEYQAWSIGPRIVA